MKKFISVCLVLVTIFLLGACAAQDNSAVNENTITVTDMIGRKVTVTPGSYKKVVCIGDLMMS